MSAGAYFFFNDTATPEIYTLSLHDALPIFAWQIRKFAENYCKDRHGQHWAYDGPYNANRGLLISDGNIAINRDRKSTRLNSSHGYISYAVFCLKKKKQYCGA